MPIRRFLAITWTLLVVALCLIPARWLRPEIEQPARTPIPHLDKLVHGVLFAGFGLLWMRASGSPKRTAWILASGVALAVLTELGQGLSFIARDPSVLDVAADVTGLVLGVAAIGRLGRVAVPDDEVAAH